ncbi:MAG: methylated-DNA--[protein]-cysteine S-methyltransferase [Gammaproteobacteria bacterium]|nr:MAG: methylated-DNA--[protein]-cysteine S-methyltransferase [Gammaproteobacteria bacterium]
MSTEPAFVDSRDFARIARAIRFIDDNFRSQPRLATIAGSARLSEFHFNRLFRRWAGITPRQYLAFVTGRAARGALVNDASVLDAAYGVGLSGPGRLHDLMVTLEAVTPGELKARGRDTPISYGFAATPFGRALIASTARGVCHLAFVESGGEAEAVAALGHGWPQARLERDDQAAAALAARIWSSPSDPATPLKLAVKGTNFQLKVWQALLELGSAGPTTYSALAGAVGLPGAARAVGQAVGANPVAWLIPCHNVLRRDGALGGYQFGEGRKRAMLAWQALDGLPRPADRKRPLESSGALRHVRPAT